MPTVRESSQPELDRREPRRLADVLRDDLVGRDAVLDVGAGRLLRVHAGEVRRGGARVVAGAVAERHAVLLRQAGEHEHVVLVRGQRLEHRRQLEARAGALRRPAGHRHAVGHVREDQALRAAGRCGLGERRRHGVEHRQGDGRAEAAQERASRQVRAGDDHGAVTPAGAARRIWNGKLFTISSTRPENAYSCCGSLLTMPRMVGLSWRSRPRPSA